MLAGISGLQPLSTLSTYLDTYLYAKKEWSKKERRQKKKPPHGDTMHQDDDKQWQGTCCQQTIGYIADGKVRMCDRKFGPRI
jgi:hypothetical protein